MKLDVLDVEILMLNLKNTSNVGTVAPSLLNPMIGAVVKGLLNNSEKKYKCLKCGAELKL